MPFLLSACGEIRRSCRHMSTTLRAWSQSYSCTQNCTPDTHTVYSRNDVCSRSWTFYFFFAEFWLVIAEIAGGLAIQVEMRALLDARDTADAVIWPYIYRVAVMSVSTKSFHFCFQRQASPLNDQTYLPIVLQGNYVGVRDVVHREGFLRGCLHLSRMQSRAKASP